MIVRTETGESISLGDELARGGEAIVYRVRDRAELLAKCYTRAPAEYQAKLRHMRASPPTDPTRSMGHPSIAWPRALIQDASGRFVGYLMPYIRDAVPLLEVSSPRLRSRVLPDFNRAYLHRVARNLASAIAALHARDYVVGDLNERNVLVTPRALATLIDVDSFQVQEPCDAHIVVYPCPVGRSEYTAPELQGRAFRGVMRKPEHDRFGLGVLIFQLLLEGNHPFRGLWRGSGEPPSVEDKIARGWFVHGSAAPELEPPPDAPALATLHPVLESLMLRCFVDGHAHPNRRPSADEWAHALAVAEEHLTPCGNRHLFSDHLSRCPYCGARRNRMARVAGPAPHAAAAAAPAGTRGASSGGARPTTGGTPRSRHVRATARAHAAVASPVRGIQRTAARLQRDIQHAYDNTLGFPRRAVFGLIGLALRPSATTASIRRARLGITLAAVLAIAACVAAFVAGLVAVAALDAAVPAAARSGTPTAASTAGLWACTVGVLCMSVVGVFRVLAETPDRRITADLVRSALVRATAAAAGWIGAWIALAAVAAVLRSDSATAAMFGDSPMTASSAAVAMGWTLGWAVYGAVAGALGGVVHGRPSGWAAAGAVFGTAGWAAVRLLLEGLARM